MGRKNTNNEEITAAADGSTIGATGVRFDAYLRSIKEARGIGGADAQDIVFSGDFDAGDGDSDLLDAYQAVSTGDMIAHGGRLYVKTAVGLETIDGKCIINGSFENLDDAGEPEFWTHKP